MNNYSSLTGHSYVVNRFYREALRQTKGPIWALTEFGLTNYIFSHIIAIS